MNQSQSTTTNLHDYSQLKIQQWNDEEGMMVGHDCRLCKNKGYIMILEDGYEALKKCSCLPVRNSIKMIKESGLEKLLNEYTYEKFVFKWDWQKNIKEKAASFLNETKGNWFFISGQPGAGKTHICTAIVGELLKKGFPALYMVWPNDSIRLKKSLVGDGDDYVDEIKKHKEIKVLYIDDFFKSEKHQKPSTADIKLAWELINYRYINKDLITIISSERFVKELIDIDEATGSRIFQMSRRYCIEIEDDPSKNIRMILKG